MMRLATQDDDILSLLDNSENDILKTFSALWKDRGYWETNTPYVEIRDGKVAGLLAVKTGYIYKNKTYTKVYYLVVHTDYKRQGIAKALMSTLDCDRVLYITEENTEGKSFCVGNGFTFLEKKENIFGTSDYFYSREPIKIQ